jgi:acetylornithine deacetylase/succinyl-diaminopimelate desuccinylase-like protein
MDQAKLTAHVDSVWEDSIVPAISRYIRIPAKSPAFDRAWESSGHLEEAVKLVEAWCRERPIPGLKTEIVRLPGRTPLLFMEIPGEGDDTVLLYGHYDKQPEFLPWGEGLAPWEPVRRGDRLYGRGGADDGYSSFASLLAIEALRTAGGRHARCVVVIEGAEESGSGDLPHYIDHLKARIGTPSLVVCLDSGCGNYDQLWLTTSLRGLVTGTLRVDVLEEGVHSGDASGVVPSSFRIARRILDRLEDADTGRILLESLQVEIPEERLRQAEATAEVLGETTFARFPWAGGTKPVATSASELVLNRTWRPYLSITGVAGIPALENAGNVLRPSTSLKLSLRLPPTAEPRAAGKAVAELLTRDPPHGARVTFEGEQTAGGWNAPATAPWLERSLAEASRRFFGAGVCAMGEGGTIPFMGMLGEKFPQAQFVITGVLGPQSNAHGPNEFLHIPTGKKLTACVAQILEDHLVRDRADAAG